MKSERKIALEAIYRDIPKLRMTLDATGIMNYFILSFTYFIKIFNIFLIEISI